MMMTTVADTTTAIIEEHVLDHNNVAMVDCRRMFDLLDSNPTEQKAVAIDPNSRRELLNLNKAKKNRRSEPVLKTRMMEATRFILFLHSHHPELVQPDLHAQLIVASSAQYSSEKVKDLSLRKIIEKTINEL